MNFIDTLNTYWELIISVFTIIFLAIWTYLSVKDLEKRVYKLEDSNLKEDVAALAADVAYIKGKIDQALK